MTDQLDYPLEECVTAVRQMQEEASVRGVRADVWQKFTCAGCGSRQTMSDMNVFHTSGSCEECGHVTDIVKSGCNYLVMMSTAR